MKKTVEVKPTTFQENRNETTPTEKSASADTTIPKNITLEKDTESKKPEQTQTSPPKEIPENILREVLRGEEGEKEK